MSRTEEILDPKIVDLEAWDRLMKYPEWKMVSEWIKYRTNVLLQQKQFLGDEPTMDNGILSLCLSARINELKALLNKAEFKKSMKRKMEEQNNG